MTSQINKLKNNLKFEVDIVSLTLVMGGFARVCHSTVLFCPKLALYRQRAILQFSF